MDIDSSDVKDPLAVVEYIESIHAHYAHYRETEVLRAQNCGQKEASVSWGDSLAVSMQEKQMMNALQFNMSVPTPYVFMRRFLKVAQSDNKLEVLSFFIIELALVEYGMLKFPPSLLAAAAIFTAQCSLNRCKQCTKATERHTTYSEDQPMYCSRLMVTYLTSESWNWETNWCVQGVQFAKFGCANEL